jgi:hypothetical protein
MGINGSQWCDFRWLSLGELILWDQPALSFPVFFGQVGRWFRGLLAENPQLFGKQNPMGFVIPGRMEHLGYHRLKPPTSIPGWWLTYPPEKYESQLGWSFPIYGKKNVPNHQPATVYPFGVKKKHGFLYLCSPYTNPSVYNNDATKHGSNNTL